MNLKPIVTEKAVRMIELDNVLTFSTNKNDLKDKIKDEIEKSFDVKVDKIRTMIKNNKKYAYVKLNKNNLAVDIATKIGLM